MVIICECMGIILLSKRNVANIVVLMKTQIWKIVWFRIKKKNGNTIHNFK